MALERIKENFPSFDYELVAWSEIDKYAIKAHDACFPEWRGRNVGDMTKVDWNKISGPIDLLVYSTPCQSISNAGKQAGLKKGSGTRSSIIWSTEDAIRILRPRWLLMENVKALVSLKFIRDFKEWEQTVAKYGYSNYWKILNAKDYGIPQNRERVFLVSTLGESYGFPKGFPLKRRLKDVLEEGVDEGYYLKSSTVKRIMPNNKSYSEDRCINVGNVNPSGKGINGSVFSAEGLAPTLTTNKGGRSEDLSRHNHLCQSADIKEIPISRYGNKRVQKLVESGKISGKEIQFIDAYNQSVNDNIAGTIRTTINSSSMHFISEPFIKQYPRGFNDGFEYKDGYAPTITTSSFEHNNFVIEPSIKKLGNYSKSGHNASSIVDSEGIAPTVMENHGTVTAVLEKNDIIPFDDYNQRIPENKDVIGTDTPQFGNSASRHGRKIIEPSFRIRKLTPRECFRLMDMDDKYIDRIQVAGISNSQQYKLAGNSIVVNVLYHILRLLLR